MTKSRKSPTLFEIIQRKGDVERGGFSTPSWFAGQSAAADEPPIPEPEIPTKLDAESDFVSDSESSAKWKARWRALLRPTNAVVAVGILAVLSMAAVQAVRLGGQDTGQETMLAADSPTIADLQAAPIRPDALDVIMGRTASTDPAKSRPQSSSSNAARTVPVSGSGPVADSSSAARSVAESSSSARKAGLNYVIVETFRGESAAADAEKARRFLAEQGVEASVERIGKYRRLVTARGFASGDKDLQQYCGRIESLGEKYFASGGRYRFKGCYGKLYTARGW